MRKKNNIFNLVGLIFAVLIVAGCGALGDLIDDAPPDTKIAALPQKWAGAAPRSSKKYFKTGWLDTFGDQRLGKIIEGVIAHNYDLQAAAARVEAAQASAKKAGAELLPALDLNLGAENKGNVKSGDNTTNFGASLDISWELDVWGRVRAGKRAAASDFQAVQADFYFARQSLAAQAAKGYFLAIETKQQQKFAQATHDNYKKSVEIAQAFFDEGGVSIQDVYLAKSELARSREVLEKAKNAHLQAIRSLQLLLGQYPSGQFKIAARLPALPKPVAAGIPSEILERRPDLFAAERRVASAFNQTTQAKAARLPRLSLTASFGGASEALKNIVNPTNLFWNAAGNLLAPIFDGGRRKADVKIATAQQKEALANYKKEALEALADVENALSNESALFQRARALRAAYRQAKLAEEIAEAKYQQGEGQLLDVQQIKRNTISSNVQWLRLRQELISERVNLYLALGQDYKK